VPGFVFTPDEEAANIEPVEKLLEAITGEDSLTIEPAYLWGALVVVVGLGLEVHSVVVGKPCDLQQSGIGVGALIVGAGLSK